MREPAMIRARGDGVEIQLAEWEGGGEDVVCVHGLTANCRCWDVIAPAIAPTHRLLAVDLRGRGLSDKPRTGYSEEHHIRDLIRVMDDLQLERAVLMGHSLGGYIAMGCAARHPERVKGLILLDAGGELSQDHWDRVTAAIKPSIDRLELTFPSPETFLNIMKQVPFLQPWSDAIETWLRYDIEAAADGVRSRIRPENIREEVSNKRRTGAARLYKDLSCPVLVLRAMKGILQPDDILLPQEAVDRMAREIPDAKYVNLNEANHYSILFQPNRERDGEILAFLEEIRGPKE
ncbi:MAG: alpha/beta hydrolase [Desulfobacterales bacterium]|nr:alpha/beta hydrolase [Desulfobacterales bacterium]